MKESLEKILEMIDEFEKKTNEQLALVDQLRATAMAIPRDKYIDKVSYVIIGAAKEFFKAKISEKTEYGKDHISGWMKEVNQHLGQAMEDAINRKAKFSRRKAVEEAFEEAKEEMKRQKSRACTEFCKYYPELSFNDLQKLLTDEDQRQFESMAWEFAESHLSSGGD